MLKFPKIDRSGFNRDPFGYSAKAPLQWNMLKAIYEDGEFDPYKKIEADELKNPVLWLTQSEALTQAALAVINAKPKFESMPAEMATVCDSQFCAVALMLVGYSLEIALKGMLILDVGIDRYKEIESNKFHHKLHDLAEFIPALNKKDRAILRCLSYFVYWAGRYPSPKPGKEAESEEIFNISEKNEICARDIFELSTKVMSHAKNIAEKSS